jgi:hypothetical protein
MTHYSNLELREQDLEAALRLQAHHHTNSLKDLITLRRFWRRRRPSGAIADRILPT